jgi:hypothetical protein
VSRADGAGRFFAVSKANQMAEFELCEDGRRPWAAGVVASFMSAPCGHGSRPRVFFKEHIESANRYYYLPVSLAQACIHMISGAHRHLRRF